MKRPELVLGALCVALLWPAYSRADPGPALSPDRAAAQHIAVTTLSNKLALDADQIEVVYTSAMNWPDSSIGCPQPGVSYLQVVTPGTVVMLRAGSKAYRVHVSDTRAIICDRPGRALGEPGQRRPAGAAITELMHKAKADLAQRLGVSPDTVTVGMVEAVTWPNSALGCAVSGTAGNESKIRGYRVTLIHDSQNFHYHTDDRRVIPCPPIELE